MAQKILGLDLGTNSIGISVRNPEIAGNVSQQLEYFTSVIFPTGYGEEQKKEYSKAAQRTKFRGSRHLYQARRYRIWRTLEVLIEHHLCPLTMEDLNKWRTYDKSKGLKREYPTDAYEFEQWVRLDFDLDGIPEYTSPYQLRAELMARQFDFEKEIERYKLGRAIYHIAQRRGFKSSKDVSLKEQEMLAQGAIDYSPMKESEEKKSKDLNAYIKENNCPTVGCAFYHMEQRGIRVRANEKYQAVRSMYAEEIRKIFAFQNGLQSQTELLTQIISQKKGEGTLFFQRPIRKGMVGKCTFEKSKTRCPISRPEFELFRAWTFLNNIRYSTIDDNTDAKPQRKLSLELKKALFDDCFMVKYNSFKIANILKWLKKKDTSVVRLNYDEKNTTKGCPICYYLKDILGTNWMTARLNYHYTYEDLWHVCFQADDDESIKSFVINHLNGDSELLNKLIKLNGLVVKDYANLSLKAILNILVFLQEGYLYNDAVVLAKLPDMFGTKWEEVKDTLLGEYGELKEKIEHLRLIGRITNNLIALDKVEEPEDRIAFHDTNYMLQDDDRKKVRQITIDTISVKRWKQLSQQTQQHILAEVEGAYQDYFHSSSRDYMIVGNISQELERIIRDNFFDMLIENYQKKILKGDVLYHPSAVDIYPRVGYTQVGEGDIKINRRLLQSPATNVFRNPMVMRVLHILRKHINQLIKDEIIDEDTRIVIETAREFNDANWRAAIKKYQERREKENKDYRQILIEHNLSDKDITDDLIEKVRLCTEQNVEKLRLWDEQKMRCIYTGRLINLSNLMNDDEFEVEHTIPRSRSFDDSLANKTICETHYNRYIKNNRCPSELPETDYQAILERIKPWEEHIKSLKGKIRTQRENAKKASTEEIKNQCIVERHVLEMELAYWLDKVGRFKMSSDSLSVGFRHAQLVDTRIITKYAFHLLRATFDNVTVQRGEKTADFRKMLGVQSLEEKKDRSKHSHHAIDATMLTLIPVNAKRDRMLELFYLIEEAKKLGKDYDSYERELKRLLAGCNIHGVGSLPDFINDNIIIRHESKDQVLTPASKKLRVQGVVVKKNNQILFKRGDSLRGQLHQQTWYGAIAEPQRDEGHLMRDKDGHFLTTGNIKYVLRTDLKYKKSSDDSGSGFEKWEDLKKVMVDQSLFEYMKSQYPEMSFKDAVEKGLTDKQGKRIRHIRCITRLKLPVEVKSHTYLSDKKYKQLYYADGGDIYTMARYVEKGGKKHYIVYSLFDISNNRKCGLEDIPTLIMAGKLQYHLDCCLYRGQQVLIYKEHPDEVRGAYEKELSKHLYVINIFEKDGRIRLVHHLSAKRSEELGTGLAITDFEHIPEKVRCKISKLNYLLEGKDFIITPKGIKFL